MTNAIATESNIICFFRSLTFSIYKQSSILYDKLLPTIQCAATITKPATIPHIRNEVFVSLLLSDSQLTETPKMPVPRTARTVEISDRLLCSKDNVFFSFSLSTDSGIFFLDVKPLLIDS